MLAITEDLVQGQWQDNARGFLKINSFTVSSLSKQKH